MKPNFQRVLLFCKLVRVQSPQHKKLSFRDAWHVAGVSTGTVVPMPDDMIAWWWKLQDVVAYDLAHPKRAAAAASGNGNPANTKP